MKPIHFVDLLSSGKHYTANYAYTDSNFTIYNLPKAKKIDSKLYSILSVLLNIIQRGTPTKLSPYLAKHLKVNDPETYLHLLSGEAQDTGDLIKGEDKNNLFPAREFYNNLLPRISVNHPYIQQLIIPEVRIGDIVDNNNDRFADQQVDFYMPVAKTVIEIDGSQHEKRGQKNLDRMRDSYLTVNGLHVIRIKSSELKEPDASDSIEKLKRIIKYFDYSEEYKNSFERCSNISVGTDDYETVKAAAAIRLQVAIIELCRLGKLEINADKWNIAVENDIVKGYEKCAIVDLLYWIQALCTLADIPFNIPEIIIDQSTKPFIDNKKNSVSLKINMMKRPDTSILSAGNSVSIFTSWRQDIDYFRVNTAKRIPYVINDNPSDIKADQDELEIKRLTKQDALRNILYNIKGFDSFRSGQERIIINALEGRDTIGVLPTGSGKSLCYQMAAMLQPSVSFVVCPIKSLMIDQKQNLDNDGINHTAFISSDLTPEERGRTQKKLVELRYWWVFLSPERFQSNDFREYLLSLQMLYNIDFGYAVIDEVHCMSEWGHSFRVSYLNLVKTIKRFCPGAILIGLTATASYNVLRNIMIEFGMDDRSNVISVPNFTREELNFEVIKLKPKDKKYETLKNVLQKYQHYYRNLLEPLEDKTRCGIIFTPFVNSMQGCFPVSNKLSSDFGNADIRCYAGSQPKGWPKDLNWEEYKRNVQNDFKENKFSLLVATKAFGMGIDKPNVRYTIHFGIPSSLEALYQEAGRAGRDKKKATCTIIYNPEKEETEEKIDKVLSSQTDTESLKECIDELGFNKNDAGNQLFLLGNNLQTDEEELNSERLIIEKYARPNADNILIRSYDIGFDLQTLQKFIYHLSVIGIVDDWTVDWKSDSLLVTFKDYTEESVESDTIKYIRKYEPDYDISEDEEKASDVYRKFGNLNRYEQIVYIFWTWYKRTIVYSRKEALKNTIEACEEYDPKNSKEFKDRMEAYFRLDDVADSIGAVADNPGDISEWFSILNSKRIKKSGIQNMIINMNRFLESYNNNTALNYISGILNLIGGRFESSNGRERLSRSLRKIDSMEDKSKEEIIIETGKALHDFLKPDELEEYSKVVLENIHIDDLETILYKNIQDNYSLKRTFDRSMNRLADMIDNLNLENSKW